MKQGASIKKIYLLLDGLREDCKIANVMMQYDDAKSAVRRLHNALNVDEFVKENYDADTGNRETSQ